MFCVGAGRRVIMSHCYSRHSSTVCTPSLCRVSLHPAHPFPGISHPRARSPPRVYPRSLDPRATRHGAVRRVERLCFYLRRRAILWTLSQRRNQRRVTCGNGRKEEGSDRHFQARFTKRRQKRCQTIIPESGTGRLTVSWTRASNVSAIYMISCLSASLQRAFSILLNVLKLKVYARRAFMFSFPGKVCVLCI